jgi:hypothetical protein
MLGQFFFQGCPPLGNLQFFSANTTAAGGNSFLSWPKPKNATLVFIWVTGSGGGGGGGAANTAGLAKGGGGGGGSNGPARFIYPAFILPDNLWCLVPVGGAGGAGGAAGAANNGVIGSAGNVSYVLAYPATTVVQQTKIAVSTGTAATAGGGGTTTTATAGAASVITTSVDQPVCNLAFTQFIAGQAGDAGATGAANTAGATKSIGTGTLILGGCGGAGSLAGAANGGAYNVVANTPFSVALAAPAGNGSCGFAYSQYKFPWFGGQGGGSSNAAVGGNGGNGVMPGTGGGGGGGGLGGGAGGKGGDGLIVIGWA